MTTSTPAESEKISLENCAKEPVHTPGHIQDIAVLIGLDETCTQVLYCSDNSEPAFSRPATAMVGLTVQNFLSEDFIHALYNALSLSSAKVQREHVGQWNNKETTFDVWAHYSGTQPIVEFEQIEDEYVDSYTAVKNVRSLLSRLGHIDGLATTLQNSVTGLRDLSGFDRVMLYQFDNNGDGEIKAEAKGPNAESFLGLRFPRWDIPDQARAIMKILPLRLIADVHAQPIPLVANPDSPPLDLTLAAARGQSPVHSEYLANMGVGATMTLSIVVHGELWGMFSFHHLKPKLIGSALRAAAELFVQFFSIQLEQRLDKENNRANERSSAYENALLDASETASNVTDLIQKIAAPICEHVDADGIAVIANDVVFQHGQTPSKEMICDIAKQLLSETDNDHAFTNRLLAEGFDAGNCAGAMVLTIDSENQDHLLFFRQEAALSVTWAGAPNKEITYGENGPRLSPRGSFAAYQQTVENQSKSWEPADLAAANHLRGALVKANFQRLSKKAERQRTVYIQELNHRIRNILALIRSVARRTKESSTSLETYAKSLEHRIAALGVAHDLAANRIHSGVEINEAFITEINPFITDQNQQLILTGDNYLIRADIAPVFALIAHELVTNCVKHGSLSVAEGQVTIQVSGDAQGVTISWIETGGPTTEEPKHTGFGLNLITNVIPYELDGTCSLDFTPEGLVATFWLPAHLLVPLSSDASDNTPSASSAAAAESSEIPENVLIVEDSMMVAIDMADMLEHFGVKQIEKCASVAQATATLEHYVPDFAVLDITLRDEQSFGIADILLKKKIPFCFASGYGSNFATPEQLNSIPVLTKPVNLSDLQKTVLSLYAKR